MNRVSRRRFLVTTSAIAGAACWGWGRRLPAADAFGGLPIGIQSYSLRNFDLNEAVRHIQGLGVHYTEFFAKHLAVNAEPATIDSTLALLKKAEIKLLAHGVNAFGKDHEANRKIFAFAQAAGIRNITADPAPDSFESLGKLCAEYNVRIAIHNHGPKHRYDKLEQVAAALKDRHPLIGACVDTGHVIRTKEDPVKWVRELGPRVFALHVKDDIKQDGGSQNVVLGKGHLDVVGVFRAVKAINFPADGCISLEYEANPANPIDDMKQCLDVAREAIAKIG